MLELRTLKIINHFYKARIKLYHCIKFHKICNGRITYTSLTFEPMQKCFQISANRNLKHIKKIVEFVLIIRCKVYYQKPI